MFLLAYANPEISDVLAIVAVILAVIAAFVVEIPRPLLGWLALAFLAAAVFCL